jgi:hypothetical protein
MSTSDVVAVIAATVVTVVVVALATVLAMYARSLRDLRATIDALRTDALELLDETSDAVREAGIEVDRVERLVSSAERLDEAKRAIATPVVKAMAFGTGVSRAAQRIRTGEPPQPPARRRRKRRAS